MRRGDAFRANREDRTGARPTGEGADPWRGLETALEEIGDALLEAQRSLDVIDTDGAAAPVLSGDDAAAEENRAIRVAYAQLAAHGARELRDELAQVRARAATMARHARELRGPRSRVAPDRAAPAVAPADAGTTTHADVVERAVAFVEAHAGDDLTIEDIAAAAGVGPRRLQEAFRARRDTTPTRFLREVRLERAHAELAAADAGAGSTVAEIAARWGFAHPGRFAVQYRRVFGCHPRYTLDTPS